MKTRNGVTYGDSDTSTFGKGGAKQLLQKVEQTPQALDLAPPFPKVETDEFCTTFSKSCLAPPIHFLQKVEQKPQTLDLAPPFSKVDFDEASAAWKLNKKSTGNGCYKYVCVKIKQNGHQCKNDSLKNCEHCKFHSTFRKG